MYKKWPKKDPNSKGIFQSLERIFQRILYIYGNIFKIFSKWLDCNHDQLEYSRFIYSLTKEGKS